MDWLTRHKKDIYVKTRKSVSRAFFKLEEIDKKFHIIHKNQRIVDLGAAPGGWCEYLLKFTKNIYAIDILPLKIADVKYINASIFDDNWIGEVGTVDVILSDVLHERSGVNTIDQRKSMDIVWRILDISNSILSHYGSLCVKILYQLEINDVVKLLQTKFTKVFLFKPKSSRKESMERFLICISKIE